MIADKNNEHKQYYTILKRENWVYNYTCNSRGGLQLQYVCNSQTTKVPGIFWKSQPCNTNSSITSYTSKSALEIPFFGKWWRSLVGYCPWGCRESDTTERLHFHFSSFPTNICAKLKKEPYKKKLLLEHSAHLFLPEIPVPFSRRELRNSSQVKWKTHHQLWLCWQVGQNWDMCLKDNVFTEAENLGSSEWRDRKAGDKKHCCIRVPRL